MVDWQEACNGRYQILTAFLICCMQLPITFTDHLLHLYGWSPPHRCRPAPHNTTFHLSPPWPIVDVQGRKMFDSCSMYLDPEDHSVGVMRCDYGWEFLHSEEEWTLVTEWDLVCEREYLINLLPYAYTACTMLGGLLFGVLADNYGRRFNLLAALFIHTMVGLALHFLHMFTGFAVGFSLQGLMVTAIQCVSFTLLLETVPFSDHMKAIVCLCMVTPLGIIVLSVVAWLIKNWRYIQLAITAPGIVCLGYFWLIPRSLPWLLAEGYTNEAESQLVQFAKFNKVMLPQFYRQQLLSFCKKIKSYASASQHSLETVVCSSKIRRYTFLLYYMWFIISLDSETSSSELPALKDNKFATLFVKGLMDSGLLILLYFFAQRFGPRSAHCFLLILGGLMCIGSVFLSYSTPLHKLIDNAKFFQMSVRISPVLSVIGKACIRSAMATSIFFTLKIFPTGVRAIGLGSCLFWARTGRLIGIHISSQDMEATYYFPLAIYGFLSIIGGLLTSFLPSNTYRPLPNVASEVEKHIVLQDTLRRKRLISTPHPCTLSSIDVLMHFDDDQDNQKDDQNTLLELSVDEFSKSLRMSTAGRMRLEDVVAGPSHLCEMSDRDEVEEDNESRLTDLEGELNRIWDINAGNEEHEISSDSLADFRSGEVREHYVRMHETRF